MKQSAKLSYRFPQKHLNLALCIAALLGVTISTNAAEITFNQQVKDALAQSVVNVHLRYRLEHVDQDNPLNDALASTLRSRITVNTGQLSGFSALLQVDNVSRLGGDTYNSTVNDQTRYSVVADPIGTDINQALLRYQNEQGTSVTAGRQVVNHINQRFLGGVAWRQNEQTLDGYRLQQKLPANILAEVGYYHNVNRIFGPKGPQADLKGSFITGLLQWQIQDGQQLSGFVYDFDFDSWASRSSRTQGLHYQGQFSSLAGLQLQLSVAKQQDAHNATHAFSHNYHRLHTQYKFSQLTVGYGNERLAGDGISAFQTPLATLHAFQGFADLFLNTPNRGLRDSWFHISYPFNKVNLNLAWHEFRTDAGNDKYGTELNLTATYKLTNQLDALFKLARYQADHFGTDTNKVWFMLSYQP